MSGLAVVVDWQRPEIERSLVEGMLARIPYRARDGQWCASGRHCSMGFALFATTERERRAVQPLHDARRGLWIVSDARLDNREELNEALEGKGRLRSDPELLLLGYERWGVELAERLIGDFAFVIWDFGGRRLYAARDPFGTRPLYYHSNPTRLVLASEVEQILTLEDVDPEPEDRMILDYLLNRFRHSRETFFRNIFRIQPGHYLIASQESLQEVRYWHPPQSEIRFARPEEYYEEFRRLFRLAVAARLDTDRPIVAELSGGIDSSSMVCMADEIYTSDSQQRQPLHLVSQVFPGLNCDETPYIDSVANKVRFPSHRWDSRALRWPDEKRLGVCHPWGGSPSHFSDELQNLVSREGVRVVLSGYGADQLLMEVGVFRDLACHGRLLKLLREISLAFKSARSRAFHLQDAMRAAAPLALRRAYRRLRSIKPERPPAWLGPRLRELWVEMTPGALQNGRSWLSHAQKFNWEDLSCARTSWSMDTRELGAAHRGLELRFPFLDVRLARFVLGVPFDHRLPGGKMKLLLRKAMEGLLPDEVARRTHVTYFDSSLNLRAIRNLPQLRAVLSADACLCEPYVNKSAIKQLLNHLDRHSLEEVNSNISQRAQWAWDIATFELWLRRVEGLRSRR